MRDLDTGQGREAEPTLLDDTARLRQEAFRKLVAMSRSFPQIGSPDPAGAVERSMTPSGARIATGKKSQRSRPEQSGTQFLEEYILVQSIGEPGHVVSIPDEVIQSQRNLQPKPEGKTLFQRAIEILHH